MNRMPLFLLLAFGCASKDENAGSGVVSDTETPDEVSDDTGEIETDCPEDVDVFEAHVWEPVLGTYCVTCHVDDGPASGTAMVFDPDDMLHNLRAASGVSDRLLLKPSGMHDGGHGGGTLVLPDSEAWEALQFWIDWTHGDCEVPGEACTDEVAPRRLWRLDHTQYQRTVIDLLGVENDYGTALAADENVDGFTNDAVALVVSGLLADQYRTAAEDLSSVVDVASMLTCTPEDGAVTQCAATFVEDFGLRAFRRPISGDELRVYLGLWSEVAEEDGFFEGLRWVVSGMLQSPHFLYRSELGIAGEEGDYALTDWEIATELSYLLWDTMPDEALFEAAAAGELHTPEQIQDQVDRMSADERSLDTTADFINIWLRLNLLQTVSRSDLDAELEDAMVEQTYETVRELARLDSSLADLMTGTSTWVPEVLASHYGSSASGWVEQDGEMYGGLLTQASVLTVYALADGSSPVHRGVMVRERMLCEELPPPPPNLDTSPPATDAEGTTREKYEVHSSLPECASCHVLIDPIGFGFEHFDHLGRWRDEEVGQPIDSSGAVDGVEFDGVQDLANVLMDDERFRSCYVQSWRRWKSGSESCADDPGDVGLMDPLLGMSSRLSFRLRTGGADEQDTFAKGSRLAPEERAVIVEEVGELLPGGAAAGVEFTLVETSTWTTGFCMDGTVTNTTSEPVVWEVSGDVSGTITSIWNAEYTVSEDEYVFTGVEWNAELGPFGSTTFGFCGSR